jgi:hypothetical protein
MYIAFPKQKSRQMQLKNSIRWSSLIAICLFMSACNEAAVKTEGPHIKEVGFESLAKSDIGVVMEIHVEEARTCLRTLIEKLYKRNPKELKKSSFPTAEENLDRLFEQKHDWVFPELDGKIGIDAIRLTFTNDYKGDRVFAFISGLSSMIMASYGYKREFFLFDSAEPQNLYNSARNIEIAVWKLGQDYDENDELYLYSNSLPGEIVNLSYERQFGKLIALQDTMAIIVAGKTSRTLIKIVQRMVTAVFLPVF